MTHKIYHSLIAALIGAATTGAVQAAPIPAMGLRFVAAEASDSSISVRSARVLPHERSMIVSMCIRVDRDLKGTESIELRPVLTDSTGHSAVLPSIFINGRTQHIAFQRDRRNAKRDLVTLRRRNGMEQTIDYLREVAYQPWMRKATLVLEEVACGCGIPIAYDSHAVATLRSDWLSAFPRWRRSRHDRNQDAPSWLSSSASRKSSTTSEATPPSWPKSCKLSTW